MDEQLSKGIKYILLASFLFALMSVAAKQLSNSMSSVEVVFFRNIFGVIFILISIYRSPLKQLGGKFWLLVFRGFIGFVALLFFFYNISNIPLGEAMTFSKTSTIFTAIFAYIFLKEKLGVRGWTGVFIGFIGILFITEFNGTNLEKSDYLGILSGIGAALAYTSVRELRKYYDSRAIVLSFMAIGALGPLILMIIGNFYTNPHLDFMLATFVMPQLSDWIFILLLGTFATLAQILMTKAYSFAKAGIIGTISYSDIAFSIILGTILGDSFPSFLIILGIILIILSGLLVSTKKN
ncbi:DMT family transporter [Aliarcobacter butzleri]|uniref:DMT family transporter n=1 Tax=Aliarcobacter butzleri TaxID=28197 RepID=UPI0021B3C9F0|nr:DMT family transporter [Aliarcobacter butzleri]MCT7555291.1 DMT family transporter [Aliarcobacter butzleri]